MASGGWIRIDVYLMNPERSSMPPLTLTSNALLSATYSSLALNLALRSSTFAVSRASASS